MPDADGESVVRTVVEAVPGPDEDVPARVSRVSPGVEDLSPDIRE